MKSRKQVIEQHRRAQRFAEMRKEMGITQIFLAEKLGIDSPMMSRMESGALPISEVRYAYVEREYNKWRNKEIKRIQAEVKRLNAKIERLNPLVL